MRFLNMDISKQYQKLLNLLIDEKPDSVIHFAEQRAAPYSMKSSFTKRYTVDNNVTVSYTHLRAHETLMNLVCRLLLEKKT